MYSVLGMTWGDVMDSDYLFKSTTHRKTIEFEASEFSDVYWSDSTILIVYNPLTEEPMFLCERRYGSEEVDESKIICSSGDFIYHVDHLMVGSRDVTDIILTRRNLYDAIMGGEVS